MQLKYLVEASCTIAEGGGDNSHIEEIIAAELGAETMKTPIRLFAIGGQPVPTNFRLLLDHCINGRSKYIPHIALIAHAAKDPFVDGAASAIDLVAMGAKVTVISPGSHKNLPAGIECIYMRGGVQTRMIDALKKDGLFDELAKAARAGVLIAGNSAGTAALSSRMIAGGMAEETLISCGQLDYANGFPFLDRVIMDTHVDRYHRHTRLMAICAENPGYIVIGVDESTAAYITAQEPSGDFELEVSGTNHVIVVSQGSRFSSNLTSCRTGEGGRRITGLEVDVLSTGDRILIPASRKGRDIKLLKSR